MMYTYRAFGLTITSEVMLSELLEAEAANEDADVVIKFGKVPLTLENSVIEKGNKIIGRDQFILNNQGIAKYYVEKGKLMIAEPYENSLFEEVKLYLLGTCFGALLHQRRKLPLHGSCINVNGLGVLLTGESGAGKSTIAAAFFRQGYKMITDDVAAVESKLDVPYVYPSYPSQKLWEDAIERLDRQEQKTALNRISKELEKYAVKSNDFFCNEPVPLKVMVEIIPADVNELRIEKLTGKEKLTTIIQNTYRRYFVKAFNHEQWHFKLCVNIANDVVVYRLTRPKKKQLEKEISNMILENILKGGEMNG